jgi:hypothetical protein
MAKPKTKLRNMNVLGAECVVVYPNLFTLWEQKVVKLLLITKLYNDQNECKLEER